MTVFTALLRKELGFWFRRPGVHLFTGLFFLLGVLTMASVGGMIDFISLGGMGGLKKADSPHFLLTVTMVWSLFATMNLASAAGGAATRDVTEGMYALVYSTPVPKWAFLLSRYLGSVAVSAYLIAAIPLGMVLGALLPGLEAERLGALDPLKTLAALLIWEAPNVVFVTALFFAIGTLTRRMFPIYIGGVFLFVGYLGSAAFMSELDNRTIGVLLDPFGMTGLEHTSRYWTAAEENVKLALPTGSVLVSRLLWVGIGLGALVGSMGLARLDEYGWQPFSRFRRAPAPPTVETEGDVAIAVPTVTRRFDRASRFAQLRLSTRRALLDTVGHRYFGAFVGAALLFELLNAQSIGSTYGTDTWPVTYQVLQIFEGTLGVFLLVIITFYAGDLVWSERDTGSDQLLDSSPVWDWAPLLAKLIALVAVVVGLMTTIVVLGPLVQVVQGYTTLEPALYLTSVYGLGLLDWIPMIAISVAIHAVVNNKIAGHAAVIGMWGLLLFRSGMGFELNLFWPTATPGNVYSDMNGWGFGFRPVLLYGTYWFALAVFVVGLARLAWVRGTDRSLRARWREVGRRTTRATVALLGTSAITFFTLGAGIAYQTLGVHGYQTTVDGEKEQVAYEAAYRAAWLDVPHPVITSVNVEVQLYPDEGRAVFDGTLQMVNEHDVPIDKLLVSFGEDVTVSELTFGIPYEAVEDEVLSTSVWTLGRPLEPGEQVTLTFRTTYEQPGIPNSGFETTVVENGTFIHAFAAFPLFGYNQGFELGDPADRRRYDLEKRDRMRDLDDPKAREHNYVTDDAHWVAFHSKVWTAQGQIPLAPGDLIAQGEQDGRVWREYRTERPVLYLLAWLSAAWEVTVDHSGRVPVEVYWDPKHPYNVQRMIDAMNQSIAVYERDFGPFQRNVLRIVEFPRYQSFAQSLPSIVPYSEGIGFIARLGEDEDDIDYVFYITAHEVAHQWWAHQVCGGAGQGATLLTESMSQYGALKVMEEAYGNEHIRRFLAYESDKYFSARNGERDEELPLLRVENQGYIHYQKGGIVLYVLSERIGRARFDAAVRVFLERWREVGPPYPTSRDFVDHLKASFPEHIEALEDGLEKVTLYDLRLESASATQVDGGWDVTLKVFAEKLYADGKGTETQATFADIVGVKFGEGADAPTQDVRITGSGEVVVRFDGPSAPTVVELDPRALFLERDRDDNGAAVNAP